MNIFGPSTDYYSGRIVYKKGSRLGPRVQIDVQLVTVHKGEARVLVDGWQRILGPGDATLLLPGHTEDFQFSQRGQTHHGWCGVRRPVLDAEAVEKLEMLNPVYPLSPRMRSIEKLLYPLSESTSPGDLQLHDTLAQAIIMEMLHQTGVLEKETQPHHPAVERALQFMREYHAQALDLGTIAAHAGLTGAHLIRLFKDNLNTTPTARLWQIRTEAATRLLRNTGLTAAEIAYSCGFANPNHFSRVFRQQMGLPPRAWRLREWDRAPA